MKKHISLIFLTFLFILTFSVVLTACIPESGGEKYTVNAFEDCSSLSIKCRADALPSTWNEDWNISNCPVEWGY